MQIVSYQTNSAAAQTPGVILRNLFFSRTPQTKRLGPAHEYLSHVYLTSRRKKEEREEKKGTDKRKAKAKSKSKSITAPPTLAKNSQRQMQISRSRFSLKGGLTKSLFPVKSKKAQQKGACRP
jgi:hypothetical protein